MTSYRYRAYGLRIDSEIPIAGWPIDGVPGMAPIEIRQGPLGPQPPGSRPWTVVDETVTLWQEGVGAFCAREGREIVVDAVPGAALGRITWCLRSSMLAALMMQRGCFPLHGSCVDAPEGAVLLVGSVGAGKSTLAALLNSRGFPLVCDDMAVLQETGGQTEVLASTPEFSLWAQTLATFGVPQRAWGEPIVAGVPKYRVPWSTWSDQSRRPRALVFLLQSQDSDVEIVRYNSAEAMVRLMPLVYRMRFLAEMPARIWPLREALAALVRGATCIGLHYPDDLQRMPDALEALLHELSTVPASPPQHWSQSMPLPMVTLRPDAPARAAPEGRPGLALLASYPKSGNTWVRSILTSWRQECEPEATLELLDGGHALNLRHQLDEVLGIDSDALKPAEYLDLRSRLHRAQAPFFSQPVPMKTHDMSCRASDGALLYPPEALAGVIYIVRNPLDVALSAANHFKLSHEEAVAMMGQHGSWEKALVMNWGPRMPEVRGSWSQHVSSWLDDPENRVLMVRYEDLLQDAVAELKRIVDFLDLWWDDEKGRKAVAKSDFQNLQKLERQKGFPEKPRDVATFFRRGQSGGWRDTLPRELARRIVDDHGFMMRRLGYGAEVAEVLGCTATTPTN